MQLNLDTINKHLITSFRDFKFTAGDHEYPDIEQTTGIRFSITIIAENEFRDFNTGEYETAILLIDGKGELKYQDETTILQRSTWINENPCVIHLPKDDTVHIKAERQCRLAIVQTKNPDSFPGRVYVPADIDVEQRGKDQLDDTCYRLVRLAFDHTIAPSEAKLVLGEVLNFPGKWSSYPPHHHRQSEIYYYEFSPAAGYGHGELGEKVYKLKHQDLLMITDSLDHSQVAAPGYYLYYIWAIRHLENDPYTGFEFTKPYHKLIS